MSAAPRLYMLSATSPGCRSIGGIFLRDLIAWYPRDCIAAGVIGPLCGTSANVDCLPWLDKLVLPSDAPKYIGREGSLMARLTRRLAWMRARTRTAVEASAAIVAHARSFAPDRLVAVLEHPLMYDIALRVSGEMRLPTSLIVEDPPEYLLRTTGADGTTQHRLRQALRQLAAVSERVGAASPRMAQVFRECYGIDALWLVHGHERDRWLALHEMPREDGELTIAFAGSMYATDAWDAFLAALSRCDWTVSGRRVCLRLIGGAAPGPIKGAAHYDVYGWRSQSETLALIGRSDIGYVPYWLAPEHEDVTSLSFPSKLSTYVAGGIPVFFHGPEGSGPAEFVRETGIGVSCGSSEPSVVVAMLEQLVEPERYCSAVQSIPRVREESLGAHVFRRRFAELIGADERAFQPPDRALCGCGYG